MNRNLEKAQAIQRLTHIEKRCGGDVLALKRPVSYHYVCVICVQSAPCPSPMRAPLACSAVFLLSQHVTLPRSILIRIKKPALSITTARESIGSCHVPPVDLRRRHASRSSNRIHRSHSCDLARGTQQTIAVTWWSLVKSYGAFYANQGPERGQIIIFLPSCVVPSPCLQPSIRMGNHVPAIHRVCRVPALE